MGGGTFDGTALWEKPWEEDQECQHEKTKDRCFGEIVWDECLKCGKILNIEYF